MRKNQNLHGGIPLAILLLLLCIFVRGEAVWLTMPAGSTKCVSEEMHNKVVALVDYIAVSEDHFHPSPHISIKVTSPFGRVIHQQNNVTHGQFAFTSSEPGNYLTCLWAEGHPGSRDINVNIDWKTGVAAKDWELVARKEDLKGIQLDLKKLEGVVDTIHENLLHLNIRELKMESVSERTNSRVALYNFMAVGVCLTTSIGQILYLKQYFHKKKLI